MQRNNFSFFCSSHGREYQIWFICVLFSKYNTNRRDFRCEFIAIRDSWTLGNYYRVSERKKNHLTLFILCEVTKKMLGRTPRMRNFWINPSYRSSCPWEARKIRFSFLSEVLLKELIKYKIFLLEQPRVWLILGWVTVQSFISFCAYRSLNQRQFFWVSDGADQPELNKNSWSCHWPLT